MSSYLRKSVLLCITAMALGHAAPCGAYTTYLDEIRVDGTDNPYDAGYGGGIDSSATDAPGTSGSSNEGGGEAAPNPACEQLKYSRPDHCPRPVAVPTGYRFGLEAMASGTGIPKAVYFADHQNGTSQRARATVVAALAKHTEDIASIFVSDSVAHDRLLTSISQACHEQRQDDTPIREALGLVALPAEKKCLESLERLTAEESGKGYFRWFASYVERNDISLADLGIPQTILNLMDSETSLERKHRVTSDVAACAYWWNAFARDNCA